MAAITANKSESVILRAVKSVYLPFLGIFTALAVGALIILVSGFSPVDAYTGLWRGAFGDLEALNRTLAVSTPYLFAALAVIVTFRAGLFSIGAEGQLRLGAIATAAVGIPLGQNTPPIIAVPVSVAAGCLVGALWGAIPGILRAFSGASEVIVTIMLNYIAGFITGYLVGSDGPLRARTGVPQTGQVGENARIPNLFQTQTGVTTVPLPLHWGFIVALLLAVGLYFLIRRTPFGFEIRTVGANPNAARYAGISVKLITVVTMTLSGTIAALGGALEILGSPEFRWRYDDGFGVGYGFDSIAIALLARNNPLAVIPAAILIGALKNGATAMQFNTTGANGQPLPGEIISIVQALVIIFIAADQVLRWLYRIKVTSKK